MLFHSMNSLLIYVFLIVFLLLFIKPILGRILSNNRNYYNKNKLLSLVEQIKIDGTRCFSVVKYDSKELFILTGGTQDIILEVQKQPEIVSSLVQKS